MRPTFSGFGTMVRGLTANQLSLDTVGHNITNADTEGYSRQRVNLITTRPDVVYGANGSNQVGTGVDVESVTRARNSYIDKQMWKETATLGQGQMLVDTLGQIEGIFKDPTDTGIQQVMDKFWSSLQTLSTNASDTGTRTVVRQRGEQLVNAITHARDQLKDMVIDTNSVIKIRVDKINQISSEVLSLNQQIAKVEVGGKDHANDLRDRRDYLIDQLSAIAKVRVTEDQSGSYTVQMSGINLVNGTNRTVLTTQDNTSADGLTGQYGLQVVDVVAEGSTQPIEFTDGEMKALIDSRDCKETDANYQGSIRAYLDKLSTMSKFLLTEFNDVQRNGYGIANSTKKNFFGEGSTDVNTPDPLYSATDNKTAGDWINALKVNPQLYKDDGLNLIAAKTQLNQMTIRQSNATGGSPTVNSTYTGTTPQTFIVRIDTVAAVTGQVSTISFSNDDGTKWNTATVENAGPPPTFRLYPSTGTVQVTIKIDTNALNKVGDTYTFTTNQGNASGDNAVLLGERLKVAIPGGVLNGSSFDTYYNSLIGTLGVQSDSAQRLQDNQTTLVNQILNWREGISGVNMDEEMSDMIRFQKGYNAAARVLTTMDEMLDTLINNTGKVGR